MVLYMKGRRKMPWRRNVAIVCFVLLLVLVNRLLVTSGHQSDSDLPAQEVSYLPTDRLHGDQDKHHRATHSQPKTEDKLLDRIKNNREMIYDALNTPQDKITNSMLSKGFIGRAQGDFVKYFQDYDESEIQDPFINKHKYAFTLNNDIACNGKVFLLALIHSAPGKSEERQMIRSTWGSVRNYSGANIAPLFLLGQVTENEKDIQKQLESESVEYKDIIQGNFVDSYRNLTAKNVMGLHWVQKYCNHTKFILKTDDDTMVNIYHLIKFLLQKSPDGDLVDFLYCSTYKNQGPRRDTSDKWYVSTEEYKYSKYPTYCEGFAYVMSYDVSKKLYYASHGVKPYWIDDVFVTGFLALKAGIMHRDMEKGHGYHLMETKQISKTVQSSMFILAKYKHMKKNWDRTWGDIKIVNKILH